MVLSAASTRRSLRSSAAQRRTCAASSWVVGSSLNPRGDFHFELKVETEATANAIVELLKERGIKARAIQRRNSYLIYLKSGTAISSFLALVGAHQSALKMENERVVKSVRNDVNRRVNAEIANQAKASAASVEQIMTIRYVLEHRGISATLPQALQEYIKLRIAYPDATLKELGEAADPPLSKSAINHRVRRVEQLAHRDRAQRTARIKCAAVDC